MPFTLPLLIVIGVIFIYKRTRDVLFKMRHVYVTCTSVCLASWRWWNLNGVETLLQFWTRCHLDVSVIGFAMVIDIGNNLNESFRL